MTHPHEALLGDMVRELTVMLRAVGEVTGQERREFEKGLYACIWLKPNKRVATGLSTSREIAVVVTTFPSLQQRTVKFAKEVILSSKGRLDSSVVLIAHQDAAGDESLCEWGKELGLLVLPVFMKGDWRRHDRSLEALLSRYLYASDPFDLAGPIRNQGQFYGRSDATDVARRLQEGQVKAYFGIRKIGKTSMINRIIDQARSRFGSVCVMADCQNDGISSLDATRLIDSVTGAIIEARDDPSDSYRSVIPLTYNDNIKDAHSQLQNIVETTSRPIVLVLDEVDFITPGSPTADHWASDFNPLFRSLRAVYQETCRIGKNFSILVGGVSSRWFFVESIRGVENAALAFVPEEYLGPFHRAQSTNMIKALGRSAGLLFADESAAIVADVCGDMPYWIRKCGSFIHRQLDPDDRPVQVNAQQCRELCDAFSQGDGAELAEVSIRHLLRVFPQLVAVVEASYAGDKIEDRRLIRFRQVLQKYGIVNETGALRGPLMAAGVEGALEAIEDDKAHFLSGGTLGRPPSVAELLDSMETDRVEFKSSARHSYREGVPEQVVNEAVLRSVAGFANARGGTLAIGIDDDGRVLGIEPDLRLMKGHDTDSYVNWLTTLIGATMGGSVAAQCRIRLETSAEKVVCLIDVPAAAEPVFSKTAKNSTVFFVRMNNSTRALEGNELIGYVKARF